MKSTLLALIDRIGLTQDTLILAGIGFGAFILVLGLGALIVPGKSRASRMMPAAVTSEGQVSQNALVRGIENDPTGLLKSLLPSEREERSRIARALAQAGINGKHAVRIFFLMRAVFGILFPIGLLLLIYFGGYLNLPAPISDRINGLTNIRILQIISVLIAIGFYGPTWWLKSKISSRRRKIENAFPNTLDLLQISVEAGMGLDTAMTRAGEEMQSVAPEIAEEFLGVQAEILAGQTREKALFGMSERMGIDEATSFVNVVLQSLQYGSSISKALASYATDMRIQRELRAQEKANKLPVQMSGVLASLMLPALLMITVGPVIIRYMRYFGN